MPRSRSRSRTTSASRSNSSTQVAWYDLRGSWGAFDWRFSAGAAWQDREFQSTSVFGGSNNENSQSGNVEFQRPLETGGPSAPAYNRENTKTDSTFAAQGTSTTDEVYAQLQATLALAVRGASTRPRSNAPRTSRGSARASASARCATR